MKRSRRQWPAKDLVEVEYLDSSTSGGWQQKKDINHEPAFCRTVGYLIKKTRRSLTLAQSIGDTNDVDAIWRIPRGAILRQRHLARTWKN